MSKGRYSKKRGVSVVGAWTPVPLAFLRSSACASLSPHASKLLLDAISMLGPNASGNGDLSLAPSIMALRGWRSRSTLSAAIAELEACSLLVQTRVHRRRDCALFAVGLYPIDCDHGKLDVGAVGSYTTHDWEEAGAKPPSEEAPARWTVPRKNENHVPSGNKALRKCPVGGQSPKASKPQSGTLSPDGTKPHVSVKNFVPPRGTFIDKPSPAVSEPAPAQTLTTPPQSSPPRLPAATATGLLVFAPCRRLLPHRPGRPLFSALLKKAAQPVEAVT